MDFESFLTPLDGGSPSGSDLRNDARFHALENRLQPAGRVARLKLVEDGGTGQVELDWAELAEEAAALSRAGRDLRLLVIVARLWVNDQRMAGLAPGLKLLAETVSGYWDSLHPALRPAGGKREAALRRINALYQLENPDGGVLGDLEFVTLLAPRGIGPVTGGDLAAGALSRAAFASEMPSGLSEKEQAALIAGHEARLNRVTAACRATAAERPEDMEALKAALAEGRAQLTALEAALAPHVTENDVGVRFDALGRFLARIAQTLDAAAAPAAPDAPASLAPTGGPAMTQAPNGAAAPGPAAIPGQINSRRDVERCLDLVIDFYERTEPSSPIPHLARRMRKMVPMNFMQLMEEIAPSGLKEFRSVAGVFEEKNRSRGE
ncbi:type VI secretion system protein TssA [Xinfangfangia pollutisoli]|uniref:type VI secretion system protein TssA n=1 Tax=Xinfangfangia pollutisoli TaxID=2865960 RepID=UPI001CD57C2D|nr:type VI secretion system ImpA family N-terminal domain-containing protein [Xinfangfangia pollutisoli]